MQVDPIGLAGGNNPFNYASSSPLNFSDFGGLYSGQDFLNDSTDWVSGFADNITFGLTRHFREFTNIGNVDICSNFYNGGNLAGLFFSFAFGTVKGGLISSVEYIGQRSIQWSHWIPGRVLRKTSSDYLPFLDNKIGRWFIDNRSLNGNYVSRDLHTLSDDYAYQFLSKAKKIQLNDQFGEWSLIRQQINRVPYWLDGFTYGIGSYIYNKSSCECEK